MDVVPDCVTAPLELTLVGTLEEGEGVDADDRVESFPLLRLDEPVCVVVPGIEGAATTRVVASELQLLAPAALLADLRPGTSVRVVGQPEASITAHHHTLLLLDVRSVTDAEESRLAGCTGSACDPEGDEAENEVAGVWTVRDAMPGEISAWSDSEAEAVVGRKVRVGAGVVAPWTVCGGARWRRTVWAPGAWPAGRAELEQDPVVSWEGRCADGTVISLIPTEAGLITGWDGAVFLLQR